VVEETEGEVPSEEKLAEVKEKVVEKAVEKGEKVEEHEELGVSEPSEEMKGEVSKIEGYDINIENVNLRITREL